MSWVSTGLAKAGINTKNVRIANTATGNKLVKSMKIIFITSIDKKNKKKYLGAVSSEYATEKNQNRIGRAFIRYPNNLKEYVDYEQRGYIFPPNIRDKFF